MQKKISVIVPIYNAEKYLRQCLDSICNQTYTDLEIILVNDCSTDSSLDICREYANRDERIKIINQKENGGAGLARISGVEAATGDVIAWVDGDDWIDSNMYNDLIIIMNEYNADIIQCKYFFDYNKKIMSTKDTNEVIVYNTIDAIKSLFEHDNIDTVYWNKLFLKEMFSNVEMSKIRSGQDSETVYKLIYNSEKTVFYCKSYYYYRQLPNSLSAGKLSLSKATALIESDKAKLDFAMLNMPELQISGKYKLLAKYISVCYTLKDEGVGSQNLLETCKYEAPLLYVQIKNSLNIKRKIMLSILLLSIKPGLLSRLLYRIINSKYKKRGYRYAAIKSDWYEVKASSKEI